MNILLVVLAVLLAALIALLLWPRLRGGASDASDAATDRLDTVAAWPPQPTRLLTSAERIAYDTLVRALPEHMVVVQVPLARFLKVPTRHSYGEWLRRAGHLCADLVVCDNASQVLAVVDIQPAAGRDSDRSRRRLERMSRVLKAAGVPLHVWTDGALPSAETARELIVPRPADLARAPAEAELSTVPGTLDGIADDDASGEAARLREPPPSTWFDEFDTHPVPLQPPKR